MSLCTGVNAAVLKCADMKHRSAKESHPATPSLTKHLNNAIGSVQKRSSVDPVLRHWDIYIGLSRVLKQWYYAFVIKIYLLQTLNKVGHDLVVTKNASSWLWGSGRWGIRDP